MVLKYRIFSINDTGTLDINHFFKVSIHALHHIQKLTQNGSKTQMWNFLEKSIRGNLCDFGLSNDFSDETPRAQSIN